MKRRNLIAEAQTGEIFHIWGVLNRANVIPSENKETNEQESDVINDGINAKPSMAGLLKSLHTLFLILKTKPKVIDIS